MILNKNSTQIIAENIIKRFKILFYNDSNSNKNILKSNVKINYCPQMIHTEINAFILKEFLNSFFSDSKKELQSNISLNKLEKAEKFDNNRIKERFQNIFNDKITKNDKENAFKAVQHNEIAKAINIYNKYILKKLDFIVYKGKLFTYNKPIWRALSEKDFIVKIKSFNDINADLEHFSAKTFNELYTSIVTSPQIQTNKEDFENKENLILFSDGVYNVCNNKIYNPSPEFKFFSYINASINNLDDINCYYFEKFVENSSNGNKNWRALLLEILGCIISGFNPKSFFVFYGPKNTGKSEFANFCKLLIGEEFCVGIKGTNAFAERWTTGSLFGKKLCLASDISNSIINSEAVAAIKSVTGNDWISGEYKYKAPFSFKNEASIVFCSNHKLQISSSDEAFFDRLIYLPFQNSVSKEKRIANLAEKLFEERGYILKETIKALQKLIKRNFLFTYVDLPDENISVFTDNNSVEEFIAEKCTEGEKNFIAFSYIYDTYCIFCNKYNFMPLNKIEFGRKFKTAVSEAFSSVEFKATSKAKGYKNLVLLGENNTF